MSHTMTIMIRKAVFNLKQSSAYGHIGWMHLKPSPVPILDQGGEKHPISPQIYHFRKECPRTDDIRVCRFINIY